MLSKLPQLRLLDLFGLTLLAALNAAACRDSAWWLLSTLPLTFAVAVIAYLARTHPEEDYLGRYLLAWDIGRRVQTWTMGLLFVGGLIPSLLTVGGYSEALLAVAALFVLAIFLSTFLLAYYAFLLFLLLTMHSAADWTLREVQRLLRHEA